MKISSCIFEMLEAIRFRKCCVDNRGMSLVNRNACVVYLRREVGEMMTRTKKIIIVFFCNENIMMNMMMKEKKNIIL